MESKYIARLVRIKILLAEAAESFRGTQADLIGWLAEPLPAQLWHPGREPPFLARCADICVTFNFSKDCAPNDLMMMKVKAARRSDKVG